MKELGKHRQSISLVFGFWSLLFLGFITFSSALKNLNLEVSTLLVFIFFVVPFLISGIFSERKSSHYFGFISTSVVIVIFSGNKFFWEILSTYWWFFLLGYLVFFLVYLFTHSAKNIYEIRDRKIKAQEAIVELQTNYSLRIDCLIELVGCLKTLERTFFHHLNYYLELENLKIAFLDESQDQYLIESRIEEIATELFQEVRYHTELNKSSTVMQLFDKIKKNEIEVQRSKIKNSSELTVYNEKVQKVIFHPFRKFIVEKYVDLEELETKSLELSVL